MDDQNSWKGHTFTLMIFGGIVLLCSIFFVLGMLVGHSQSIKMATVAAAAPAPAPAAETPSAKASAKESAKEEKPPDLTFYESVDKKKSQPLVTTPPPAPAKVEPPAPAPVTGVNFQVSALKKQNDAEKMVGELKKKGFRAFILNPAPNDRVPFYRVQVGPFSDPVDAEAAKQKLEKAGYKPIKK
jgi:cell division septation protein DedD